MTDAPGSRPHTPLFRRLDRLLAGAESPNVETRVEAADGLLTLARDLNAIDLLGQVLELKQRLAMAMTTEDAPDVPTGFRHPALVGQLDAILAEDAPTAPDVPPGVPPPGRGPADALDARLDELRAGLDAPDAGARLDAATGILRIAGDLRQAELMARLDRLEKRIRARLAKEVGNATATVP